MEICPECGERTLCYDPQLKSAKCLRFECDYRRAVTEEEYSRILESSSKNVVSKLTLNNPTPRKE